MSQSSAAPEAASAGDLEYVLLDAESREARDERELIAGGAEDFHRQIRDRGVERRRRAVPVDSP